jgi:hypothetical protein
VVAHFGVWRGKWYCRTMGASAGVPWKWCVCEGGGGEEGVWFEHTQGGGVLVGAKNQNQATMAQFWQMKCGACGCVGRTYMGWEKLNLRVWGCSISCRKGKVGSVVLTWAAFLWWRAIPVPIASQIWNLDGCNVAETWPKAIFQIWGHLQCKPNGHKANKKSMTKNLCRHI